MKKFTLILCLLVWQAHVWAQADCLNALTLTPGTEQCGNSAGQPGDFPGDGSAPTNPCNSSYNDDEYWFSYTATTQNELLQLNLDSIDMTWSGIFVLDDCPNAGPTCIASATAGSGTGPLNITTPGLDLGVTYYVVISNFGTPNNTSFCLNSTVLPPPPIPGCATILSPDDGERDVRPVDVNTFFIVPTEATDYYFMMGTSAGALDTFYTGVNDMDTILDFPDFPNYGTEYFWQIIPYNTTGAASGCPIRSFTTISLQDPPSNSGVDCGESTLFPLFNEDFSSIVPTGWTGDIATGTTAGLWHPRTGTTPSSGSGTGPSGAQNGTHYLYFESSAGTDTASTITPAFDLSSSTTGAELEFYVHMFGSAMGNMLIEATADTTGGGTWTTLGVLVGPHQEATTDPWEVARYNISSFNGGNVYIRFTAQPFDQEPIFLGDMAIDALSIKSCISCPPPTDGMASNLSLTGADLSWTVNGSESNWELAIDTAGFTLTSPTVSTGSNPYSWNGGIPNTDYEFYVRAVCGPMDTSSWAGPFAFSTPGMGDVCTTAFPINVQMSCDTSNDIELDFSTLNPVEYTSCDATGTNYGRWFEFTAPSTGNINIITTSTTSSEMALFDACGGSELYCTASTSTADRLISGLTPSATYYLLVWEDSSTPVTSFCIEEGPACLPLSGLTIDNITFSSGDASWTGNASSTGFVVEYGPDGFTPGNGTQITTGPNGGPVTIPSLMQNTAYDVYVWEICMGTETDTLGPTSFTTTCGIQVADYCQGFELFGADQQMNGQVIDCWYNVNSTGTEWESEDAATGSSDTGPNGPFAGTRYIYLETTSGVEFDTDTLFSPQVDVSGLSVPEFSFYYHMYGATMGSLYWEISDNGGVSWTQLGSISGQQQSSGAEPWESVTHDISTYGNTVMIRFIGEKGSSFTSDMAIDEVCIREMPSCTSPTALAEIGKTSTSVELGWNEVGSSTDWVIEYGPTGFTPGMGASLLTTNNPETVGGLIADTEYDFYVRSICGPGDTSNYIGPLSVFTGYCLVVSTSSLSYINNFSTTNGDMNISNLASGYAPDGYEDATAQVVSQFPTGSIDWTTSFIGTTVGYNIWIDWNNDLDFDDAGEKVYASGAYVSSASGTITVPGSASIGDYRMRMRCDWNATNPVACGASGSGRNETEDYTFSVIAPPTCLKPSALMATNVSGVSADLSWTENNAATSWQVEYGITGFMQGTGTTFITGNNPHTLMGLTEVTSYDFYVRSICSPGDTSTWSDVGSFTTPCENIIPDYLADMEIFLPDCWDEGRGGNSTVGPTTTGASDWTSENWANQAGGGSNGTSSRLNAWQTESEWLLTANFDLSGSVYALSFDIAATEFNQTTPAVWPSTDTLYLLVSTNGGAAWSELQKWTSLSVPSASGDSVNVDLSAYSATARFAFYYTTGGIDSPEDIEIFVDNFEIKEQDLGPCGPMDINGVLASGTYKAGSITSDALIESPNVVIFKAENGVDLIDEFEVELGAEFDVMIEDCP